MDPFKIKKISIERSHMSTIIIIFSLLFLLLSLPFTFHAAVLNVCASITLAQEEYQNNPQYTGIYALEGRQISQGWHLWAEVINAKGGILINGTTYFINLTVINHGGADPARVASIYARLLNGSYGVYCNFMFGPWTSALTAIAAIENEKAAPKRTMFSLHGASEDTWKCTAELLPPCTQEGFRRFQYSWSGAPTASQLFVPAIDLLLIKKPQTIATFDFIGSFSKSLVAGAVEAAESNDVQVVGQHSFSSRSPNASAYDDLVSSLVSLNPDIVAGCTLFDSCIGFLEACERHNYTPKALIVSLCLSNPAYKNTTGRTGRYLMDFLSWDPKVKGPEFLESLPPGPNTTDDVNQPRTFFNYFPAQRDAITGIVSKASPKVFAEVYYERWGQLPIDPLGNGAVVDGYLLEWAVTKAQSIETEHVQSTLPLIAENSFYGKLAFDIYGKNDKKTTLVTQTDGNLVNRIIYPNSAIEMEVIYPIPAWNERSAQYGWFHYWGDIVIAVLACFLILLSIAGMIWIATNNEAPVVAAAQPEFLGIILLGSIVCYLSVFCWLYYVNDASCAALPWLIVTGFFLIFGALFVKTLRLYQVYRATQAFRTTSTPLWYMGISLVVLLSIVWGLLIPWTIFDPLQQRIVHPDPHRPIHDYTICSMGTTGTSFLIAILVTSGVLLIVASWAAFATQRVKYLLYQERRFIGFGVYNLVLISAVGIGLIAGLTDQPIAQFWVRAACLLLAPFLVVSSF